MSSMRHEAAIGRLEREVAEIREILKANKLTKAEEKPAEATKKKGT